MYNGKELKTSSTAQENRKNPYSKDVIYDPAGQWKYPGQVTRIPGGDITMKGVSYPVLGVDDQGNEQMMLPGENYIFPGAMNVTEYPQMQYGGDISIAPINHQFGKHETKWLDAKAFGGQNSKTGTQMQKGGAWGTPEQMYNDSLNLWKAYQFQKSHAAPGYNAWLNDVGRSYSGGPEALRKVREKNIGHIGKEFYGKMDKKSHFIGNDKDYDPLQKEEQVLVNYYKSLPFSGPTRIGKHSSPDIWHKHIQPVGSYFEGSMSPIYKKPVYNPSVESPKEVVNNKPLPTPKEEPKKEEPKKVQAPVKDYHHRNIDFGSASGAVMKYYDEASKLIRTEPYTPQKQNGGWLDTYQLGGSPDVEKARAFLDDGAIYGHPLSQAQIAYFTKIAGPTDEEGEFIEEDLDEDVIEEMRRGGVSPLQRMKSPRSRTSKNIKTSVNKLFVRNHDLFGPSGTNLYDPNAKKWLEKYK